MKIGEKKYEPILKTLGPGEYSPEKADPLVKSKIKSVLISKSKSRQNSRTPSPRLGPGHYNVNSNDFGQNCKNMTIGQKRDDKIYLASPGPG